MTLGMPPRKTPSVRPAKSQRTRLTGVGGAGKPEGVIAAGSIFDHVRDDVKTGLGEKCAVLLGIETAVVERFAFEFPED